MWGRVISKLSPTVYLDSDAILKALNSLTKKIVNQARLKKKTGLRNPEQSLHHCYKTKKFLITEFSRTRWMRKNICKGK